MNERDGSLGRCAASGAEGRSLAERSCSPITRRSWSRVCDSLPGRAVWLGRPGDAAPWRTGTGAAGWDAERVTTDAPAAAPPSCVDDVVARMQAIGAALPADDGVAVFNRVYLSVTEELRRRLAAGFFQDPDGTARLALVFAQRYLAAVEPHATGRRPPACWRPLLQLRRHRGIRPLQFALAGINAHVTHDLPLAVVDTCRSLGCRPHRVERDFERVGRMLEAIEERIREELMPGPDLLDVADPLTHLIGSWELEQARQAAWSAARLLWDARELPRLYEEFAHSLDAGAGLVSRCLLTPLGGHGQVSELQAPSFK